MISRLRVFAAVAAFALPTATLVAQSTSTVPFGVGDRVASVGVMTGGDYDGSGVGAMAEWGVLKFTPKVHLGIGGFAGVQRNSETAGSFKVTSTVIPIMAQGNLHFALEGQPKLDLFAGASIGLIRASADCTGCTSVDASNTDSAVGIQGGARLNIASALSVVGQLGFGDLPLIFAGISFKF